MTDLWKTAEHPIVGLAPMNGVTDHAFRRIQKKYGQPALLFTEFTPVNGVCAGAEALLKDLMYDESQRPIIAQIYGTNPHQFYQTAIVLCQLGFDGIDINMGCPSRTVTHAGAGAGLIRTPQLAQQIVQATKRGVRDWLNGASVHDYTDVPAHLAARVNSLHAELPDSIRQRRRIPVSVKTRIGYTQSQVNEWIPALLDCELAAISIHGRTLVQGYAGDADWSEVARAAEIARGSGVRILGNGDLTSLEDAHQRVAAYGLDGALIGRASYGNPHIWNPSVEPESQYALLDIALEHSRLYEASFSRLDGYHFLPMRKHLGWYARQVPSASWLRRSLTQTSCADQAECVVREYLDYRKRWEQ